MCTGTQRGLFFPAAITGRPCKDDDFVVRRLIHRTVRDPESDCFWLTIHSYRHFAGVCEAGDGGGGWVDKGALHCRFLCKMLSTAGKLVQHLL